MKSYINVKVFIDGQEIVLPRQYESLLIRSIKNIKRSVLNEDLNKLESQISFINQSIINKKEHIETFESRKKDLLESYEDSLNGELNQYSVNNYGIPLSNLIALIDKVESSTGRFIKNKEVRSFFQNPTSNKIQSKVEEIFRVFLPDWKPVKSRGYYGFRRKS